jgi:hypothetical protein
MGRFGGHLLSTPRECLCKKQFFSEFFIALPIALYDEITLSLVLSFLY